MDWEPSGNKAQNVNLTTGHSIYQSLSCCKYLITPIQIVCLMSSKTLFQAP